MLAYTSFCICKPKTSSQPQLLHNKTRQLRSAFVGKPGFLRRRRTA